MSTLDKSSSIFTLETTDEKKMRMIITAVAIIAFLGIGFFFLPRITQIIHNWIDFGIALMQLFIIAVIIGTLFVMRNVLLNLWKALVRKMTRWLIKTNLPDLLEVVVANRRAVLAKFNDSIHKMMNAITLHERKMTERKKSMQDNLDYATQFRKQAENPKADQHTKEKADDQAKHFGREAAEDKKLLESMQADKEKMLKSYNFFDRLYNNLQNSTESVANTIGRLKDQLETSDTWREAAQSASSLLGVSEFETITLEETRNRIAQNEAEVMMMIHDHETLLMKMEAENGIMDDAGQKLLEQYSNKVDVFAFMENKGTDRPSGGGDSGLDTSWLSANQDLLK
ncbi:hypothetical protein A3860_10625 [Niastella vici]|uniref:Uncharacterized protein n=1 Tax=Niastella vici TaxID=1703345 RepID=A0A1V9FF78_9BACT|nr:hypothetical protein [Niastella vici]OQP57014.1 hypothetical protein A3860_10625 [Niastella vici]